MKKISSRIIPSDIALPFFLDVIRTGGAKNLVDVKNRLSQGVFNSIAPSDVDDHRLLHFEIGGIIEGGPKIQVGNSRMQHVSNTIEETSFYLEGEINAFKMPIALVHELLINEHELESSGKKYEKIDEEIYLVYDLEQTSIETLIRNSLLSWHFLAYFLEAGGPINSVDLLWQQAKYILVGAYDGESFLYWRPFN